MDHRNLIFKMLTVTDQVYFVLDSELLFKTTYCSEPIDFEEIEGYERELINDTLSENNSRLTKSDSVIKINLPRSTNYWNSLTREKSNMSNSKLKLCNVPKDLKILEDIKYLKLEHETDYPEDEPDILPEILSQVKHLNYLSLNRFSELNCDAHITIDTLEGYNDQVYDFLKHFKNVSINKILTEHQFDDFIEDNIKHNKLIRERCEYLCVTMIRLFVEPTLEDIEGLQFDELRMERELYEILDDEVKAKVNSVYDNTKNIKSFKNGPAYFLPTNEIVYNLRNKDENIDLFGLNHNNEFGRDEFDSELKLDFRFSSRAKSAR